MAGTTLKVLALALCGGFLAWSLPAPAAPPTTAAAPAAGAVATASPQGQHQQSAHPASPAWQQALRQVREDFPGVRQMTTQKLADLLTGNAAAQVVLLDARPSDEFDVSHLHGAVQANTARKALDALATGSGERIVVTYCSVGYRSSKLAAQLQARGVANLYNLEGSLFRWANEGRPLHRGNEPANRVHPYDDEWGQLLDSRFRPR